MSSHLHIERPAIESHASIFAELDAVLQKLHQWIDLTPIPDDETHHGVVTAAILFRAANQLRAIIALLKGNFWEDALILTRALFELLLNTEELVHRCPDQEQGAARFLLFSELQKYLEWVRIQEYQVASGRAGPDFAKELVKIEKSARKFFSSFSFIDKKGHPKWRMSWCNKKVAQLSEASPNPMRRHQYRLLYSSGSDFAHASPLAALSTSQLYRSFEQERFLLDAAAREDQGLRMVAAFALIFLGEIFTLVGTRVPSYQPDWIAKTLGGIIRRIFGNTADTPKAA